MALFMLKLGSQERHAGQATEPIPLREVPLRSKLFPAVVHPHACDLQ